MTSLSTGSYRPSSNAHPDLARRFTASTRFEVKFRDFARLGSFATTLSATPFVSIAKVEWRLTAATEASLGTQSRQLALQDAIAKATDFADVLGKSTVMAEEVNGGYTNSTVSSTQAFMGARQRPHVKAMMMASGGGVDGEEDAELSFEPQSVTLTSNVNVKFVAE
jgi:uncharacterized protein